MAEFENPTFDPDGPGIDDDYSFDLPDPPLDPPLDVKQQLDASRERIQSMRGEIRQGELEDQKKRLQRSEPCLWLSPRREDWL